MKISGINSKFARCFLRLLFNQIFPEFERMTSREELLALGEQWRQARTIATTRPHTNAPTRPPANIIANATIHPLDAAKDAVRYSGLTLPLDDPNDKGVEFRSTTHGPEPKIIVVDKKSDESEQARPAT